MKPPSGIPESVSEQRARPFTSAEHCYIDRRLDGDQAGCSAGDCTCACPNCCAARVPPPTQAEVDAARDEAMTEIRARGLAMAAGLNELRRRQLFPESPPRDPQAVMKQALVGAGLLPSPLVVDVLDHHVYDLADRPQREFVKLKPGEPDPSGIPESVSEQRARPFTSAAHCYIDRRLDGDQAGCSAGDCTCACPDCCAARRRLSETIEPLRLDSRVLPSPNESVPGQPDPRSDPAPGFALVREDLLMPGAAGLLSRVDFKTGPIPDLAHPGELLIALGKPTDNHRSMMPVVVAFHSADGVFVLDSGEVSALDLARSGEVVMRVKLPERGAPACPDVELHGSFGGPARISLVNAPTWEVVAERARKAGIEPDPSLCGALWLALAKLEEAVARRNDAELAVRKARAKEARTGTKLGEARKAIDLWAEQARETKSWLRDQAADIDGDLPVAELDELQLRAVIGVELLRLRRVAADAQAEADRAMREVEASNHRHGELVAERAALRLELEAARMTNQALAYPGRDDEGRLLKPGHVIEADDADRWGLNDREYLLFRLGQRGAKGADVAGAGVHRLAYLLDVAEGNRRDGPAMPSIEAQREALVAANPPPRSPFTPEQERAIGSLVGRVTVQPRGQPSRWEAFVDGVLDVPEVVFAASEQSAKNLACVVIARKRWPDLWPETA